ncbi:MAG: hypothetical protein ACUVRQ_05890 [Thermoanaerobaculaceae bacterium]
MLESKQELGTYHGRLAIGILVLPDLSAVALLTLADILRFSPWLPALLLLPLLRHLLGWLWKDSGWEELLVLFGLAAALGGGKLFWQLGLTPELGALMVGSLLSDHHEGTELARALWSVKGFSLLAFFLNLGLEKGLAGVDLGVFLLLMALATARARLFSLSPGGTTSPNKLCKRRLPRSLLGIRPFPRSPLGFSLCPFSPSHHCVGSGGDHGFELHRCPLCPSFLPEVGGQAGPL